MRKLSIRFKITLWFMLLLLIIVSLTYVVTLSLSKSYMEKSVQDTLIETVENNVDEIEFYKDLSENDDDNDSDQYISYNDGYLEIDDDYLDRVNGVSTALYRNDGILLYGENPIDKESAEYSFSDSKITKITVSGTVWYVFDRTLEKNNLDSLWLRGVISSEQETTRFSSIVHISLYIMPILVLIAIIGGYLIAGRSLRPVNQIAKTATEISQGSDLKKRIELGTGTDELYQLADTFNEMFDRLESSFNKEKQFTSDISHELRTPTSVILAQCDYTLEKDRNAEEYKDALAVIQRQGKKMSKLVNDMLFFTRIEQQSSKKEMTDINLSELTNSICEDMALIKDKNIKLTCSIEEGIHIYGNESLLTCMLTNLISNAYRYGKTNGKIDVSLCSEKNNVYLNVSDDGIGISKDDIIHIFQRFYQAEQSHTGEGAGLGLAMVQEIVSLHGGTISVDSVIDNGSTFKIKLKKI